MYKLGCHVVLAQKKSNYFQNLITFWLAIMISEHRESTVFAYLAVAIKYCLVFFAVWRDIYGFHCSAISLVDSIFFPHHSDNIKYPPSKLPLFRLPFENPSNRNDSILSFILTEIEEIMTSNTVT